jgi:hypothetical protein
MSFDKLQDDVLPIDPKIRYVVIQNNVGEKILDEKHLLMITTETDSNHTAIINDISNY